MYSQPGSTMAPPQKAETFMLSDAAQQNLPQDAQVALQQVDNRKWDPKPWLCSRPAPPARPRAQTDSSNPSMANCRVAVKYFLISAPVDWNPDQYIRRFLLPTGEYVSCVLW